MEPSQDLGVKPDGIRKRNLVKASPSSSVHPSVRNLLGVVGVPHSSQPDSPCCTPRRLLPRSVSQGTLACSHSLSSQDKQSQPQEELELKGGRRESRCSDYKGEENMQSGSIICSRKGELCVLLCVLHAVVFVSSAKKWNSFSFDGIVKRNRVY